MFRTLVNKFNPILLLMTLMFATASIAIPSPDKDPLKDIFASQQSFLEVDEAFLFNFEQKGTKLTLSWVIATDYYLYKDKFKFAAENATIIKQSQPEGSQIEDEFFGATEVYFFEAIIELELDNIEPGAQIKIRYQGCANAGLCYNPVTKVVDLDTVDNAAASTNSDSTAANSSSQQNQLAESLNSGSFLVSLLIFFGLGVGLAFTPCVFPMFPILSGIIAGQQNLTIKKGLYLAFIYVQGMALTYSLLGLVVASMGVQFQAYLQHPSVLIATSIIFVLLACAMFGWINLQLPASWTSKLTEVSNKQKSGNVFGVFAMGLLSGLIASPCTTAPLTGALLYVAQTGDLFIGFITLYVLSLGMGLPLLVIGASGGKLLPKAGAWMDMVKVIFGFILLSIPLILLERIVELSVVLQLAGVLLVILAAYLRFQYLNNGSNQAKSIFWTLSITLLLSGLVLVAKPWMGNLTYAGNAQTTETHTDTFIQLTSLQEIQQQVAQASAMNKIVMLDFYADWCVACKEFEAYTFSDTDVKAKMADFVLLQVDMTENTDQDLEILEYYNILGLPTIMFFDPLKGELTNNRVTGFMNATLFNQHLKVITEK
ncbi:protein-disulfide reductase DsbD [Psychrosphaera aquimarina]|uniref:Thiol:disulfide interchange protein DsbD n=1 Tax=Psychrosphaera aquimarina TaxID=2044854 RepID=A0ABU3QXG4_9GAMM|nr:protein-disulfide reductase DsbD [Psychrosphaera aquimarina]MDU0112110.1 protein-disulfide reductase DsbD [Psychrosphaera aquimarina]